MKIAIIGAGHIGLYIGGRLLEAGADVTFVGRTRMHEHLRRHGLKINSYKHEACRIPNDRYTYLLNPSQMGKMDFILVTVKTTQTDEVLKELRSVIHTETKIINLQNGIGNEEVFYQHGLKDQLIQGMVMFNVVLNDDQEFFQSSSGPVIIEQGIDMTLLNVLQKSRFEFKVTNNIEGFKWSKLFLNLNNAVNALSGIPLKDELEQLPFRRVLALLMKESLLVSKALNIKLEKLTPIDPRFVPVILNLPNFLFKKVAKKMIDIDPSAKASMLMDLERNARTEIDFINGKVVSLGEKLKVKVPFNTIITRLIKEAELKKKGSPQLSGKDLWAQLQ